MTDKKLIDIDSTIDAEARRTAGLSPEELGARRRAAATGTLQLTNRILTGDPHQQTLGVVNPDYPAGWTTGTIIYINYHHLDAVTDEEIAALWGLNYHELGHVLITPRSRGDLRDRGKNPLWATAFNIMEDWRVESQFAAMFSSAERNFNLMFHLLLANHKKHVSDGHVRIFPLSVGRYYLDPHLRKRYELLFTRDLDGKTPRDFAPEPLLELSKGHPHEHLLDVTMPEWTERIKRLAVGYVSRFWGKHAKDARERNRELIDMIDQFMFLTPWELLDDGQPLGLPVPGARGYTGAGADMPAKSEKDDAFEMDTTEAVLDVLTRDQEEMDRLEEVMKELGLDPQTGRPTGPPPPQPEGVGEGDDDEEADGAAGGDDEEADEGDGAGEGSADENGADAAGVPSRRGQGGDPARSPADEADDSDDEDDEDGAWFEDDDADRTPRIRVDPRQNAPFQDTSADGDELGADQDRDAGMLTAQAGDGRWGEDPGWWPAQLTEEQRLLIEKVFSTEKDFDSLITEEVARLLNKKETRKAINAIHHAVAEATGEGIHLDPKGDGDLRACPPMLLTERNRFAKRLLEVRNALEGGWVPEQRAGKVNVRRWINGTPSGKLNAFDQYLHDETDEAGLEAVILLDRSSSMASVSEHASQIAWMVGSAIQKAEGLQTLISYADEDKTEVLAGRDTVLRRSSFTAYATYGGTHAAEACDLARKVLAASPMPNRLLAIVTDGGWADVAEAVRHIRRINADGVETLLILMGMHQERSRRGCKHVVHANDLNQVSRELKRFVARMQHEAARRVVTARGVMVG